MAESILLAHCRAALHAWGVADYVRIRTNRDGEVRGRCRVGNRAGVFGIARMKPWEEHSFIERLVARRSLKRLRKLGILPPPTKT